MPLNLQGARNLIARRCALPALAMSLVLNACIDPASAPVTGSLASSEPAAATQRSAKPTVDVGPLAAAHKANPANATAALAYARALRVRGAKLEALAVLDRTAANKHAERGLKLERGLLALELGETAKAEKLLRQAAAAGRLIPRDTLGPESKRARRP